MADYIAPADGDFNTWVGNFVPYVVANKVALGVSTADADALQAAYTAWSGAFGALLTAQAAAETATNLKDTKRDLLVVIVRSLTGQMQKNPAVTDAQRQSLQINIADGTRTPAAIPTTKPVLKVDTSQRFQHTIGFSDESTPTSRAKPNGVMGCELWAKIGDPAPAGPDDCEFLALATRTPDREDYEAADGGKPAYIMGRWVNTRGQKGPWSAVVKATIAA